PDKTSRTSARRVKEQLQSRQFFLRKQSGAPRSLHADPSSIRHRFDRPLGLRKIHISTITESHERSYSRRSTPRKGRAGWAGHLFRQYGRHPSPASCRYDFSEIESLSDVHI